MAAEALQHARRGLLPRLKVEGLGQVVHVALSRDEIARGPEVLDPTSVREGRQDRHRTTAVRDLDRLARLDTSK